MKKILLIMCVITLVLSGSVFGAWDDANTPIPFFVSPGAALNVPFDSDMEAVDYGHKSLQQGTWQFLNGATWTHDKGIARYSTTLENDDPTVTSMRTDGDWIFEIEYQHTGWTYDVNDTVWYAKSEPDDMRIVMLRYVGGGGFNDLWELCAGNATGGWDVIPNGDNLVLGEDNHIFVIHYKAANQRLDIYMNDTLLAGDYELGHGRYDLNFVQIQGIYNDPTDYVRDVFRSIKVYNGVRRDEGFGYEWIRKNPFTITGVSLLTDGFVDNNDFAGTNISTMLAVKVQPTIIDQAVRMGLPWHLKAGSYTWTEPEDATTQAAKTNIQLMYDDPTRPGGTGFMAYDEPEDVNEMNDAANKASWFIKQQHPEMIVYSNTFVMSLDPGDANRYQDYMDHLDDFVSIIKPDVLHADSYPFELTSGTPPHTPEEILENSYYLHLKAIRSTALDANIPYWMFIQSFEGGGRLLPSESDLRMQIFSTLTYGFTGISYFRYTPEIRSAEEKYSALLDPNYVPNYLYYAAQDLNPEVINVGQSLRLLESTDIGYVVGQHLNGSPIDNNLPQGTVAWTSADDPYITDINATNLGSTNDGLAGDVLVGYFTLLPELEDLDGSGYEDEIYFMITNLLRDSNSTAAQTQQQIRIDFDFGASGITGLQRLSRDTGLPEDVSLVSDGGSTYHLDLTLDGGTGDLFKFNTGATFVYKYCDYYLTGDMNTDCIVDFRDLDMFLTNWLDCTDPQCD